MLRTTKTSLLWWFFCCLQAAGAGLAYYFGMFDMLQAADPTYISFGIIGIHIITTLLIGWRTIRDDPDKLEPFWFVSETQMGLGMLGTLVGFIMLLTHVFTNLDPSNHAAIKAAISMIATGTGTAIWTTLVGLISAILIRAQLVNLERDA